MEIILVDNVSKDNSHKIVKEKFPQIKLVENKENLGYCGGNNVGIKQCRGEIIIILNPDTVVTQEWIENMMESYKRHGEGLYQPKLLSYKDKNKINSGGNWIQTFGFGFSSGKGHLDATKFNLEQEIGYASGACLFTSRKVLEKIGHFDEFLFAYHDDLELGWRALNMGIKSFYVPSSIVYHAESLSFGWGKRKFFLLERNRWYCLLIHFSRKTLYKMMPSLILIEILIFLFYLSKGMAREKASCYTSIIKNRKRINQRYEQIQMTRKLSDKDVLKKFVNIIEVPRQVSSDDISGAFNKILSVLSRASRRII